MEANGRSTSADTPNVVAVIVVIALLGLIGLNRLSLNVKVN